MKCLFCKKIRHRKKNCFKFTTWLEKKRKEEGNFFSLVCFESNMIDVSSNSWGLDSGVTVHVAITLQRFTSKRKSSDFEAMLRVRNDAKVDVELVGVVSRNLETSYRLILENIFYISSFRRNLISISLLD